MKIKETYLIQKEKYDDYIILIKVGNFYNVLSKDAQILSTIFNYKKNTFTGTIKVGFPISSLNKILKTLDNLKINYIVYENKVILKQKFKKNKYYGCLKNNITVDERIELVHLRLLEIKKTSNILDVLDKVENIICKKN